MANKKEQGTYEETLNNSEAVFLKYKKQIFIAVAAVIIVIRITYPLHVKLRQVRSWQRAKRSSMHSSMTRHCQVSRRYKATIAVLMQATLPTFT